MYIISFLVGYVFVKRNIRARGVQISNEQYDSLLFNILLGVILGARIGYIVFYDLETFIREPLRIFAVWQGGMSFHGGWLGVVALGFVYVKRHKLNFYGLADAVVPFCALGLGFGRIGNFINGELYGRVTNVPWAMVFPGTDGRPRHPSQLYQALTEGFILFVILQIMQRRVKRQGITFWSFIGLYGLIRFFVEFFREPDYHIGYLMLGLTMGQILCLGMIVISASGFYFMSRKKRGN